MFHPALLLCPARLTFSKEKSTLLSYEVCSFIRYLRVHIQVDNCATHCCQVECQCQTQPASYSHNLTILQAVKSEGSIMNQHFTFISPHYSPRIWKYVYLFTFLMYDDYGTCCHRIKRVIFKSTALTLLNKTILKKTVQSRNLRNFIFFSKH